MAVLTFEGTAESGRIRLRDDVTLPEHATVYVIIPTLEHGERAHMRSPRLARPEQAAFFAKEVAEVPADAEL